MTNRTALKVLLAALEIEQRALAKELGYEPGYVANVFNGCTPPSDAFKRAFGDVLADLLLGASRTEASRLPAQPLAEFLATRAKDTPCKSEFYAELGLSPQGWDKRRYVTDSLVDRVCCALGVHPSAIYGREYEVGNAS